MKYRDSIYFHADDTLYVNLFIPSTVRWQEQKAVLTQTTSFPATEFTLKLRHPGWSKGAVVLEPPVA